MERIKDRWIMCYSLSTLWNKRTEYSVKDQLDKLQWNYYYDTKRKNVIMSTHRLLCIIEGRRIERSFLFCKGDVIPCFYYGGKTDFIVPIRN